MESFTHEDLLQYLYKETTPEKTLAIKTALVTDWSLREKLEELETTSKNLENISLSPRKATLDFIMNYAEKKVEELTPHA
ncbi:MAG: hypothetical protein WKF35_05565 [Ferruginibacter sp.]